VVILLGLAAAVLYGSGDFLGGMATRRVHVLAVLAVAETAAVIAALAAVAMWPSPATVAGLAWGISAGLTGGLGLIIFYAGLAAGPMSVVAPVSGLVSTILPVAVALAQGERPGAVVYAGALLCLVAIVLASSAADSDPAISTSAARAGLPVPGRALGYGIASGTSFGLFFLLIRNAGRSGELWPIASGRIGELAVIVIAAVAANRSSGRRPALGGSRLRRSTAAAARTTASSPIRPAATGHSSLDGPGVRTRRKNRPNDAPDAMPYPRARPAPGRRNRGAAPGRRAGLASPAELASTIAARHSSAPA